jgi:hypothetical protein
MNRFRFIQSIRSIISTYKNIRIIYRLLKNFDIVKKKQTGQLVSRVIEEGGISVAHQQQNHARSSLVDPDCLIKKGWICYTR